MLKERNKHRILPSGTVIRKDDYFPLADKIKDDLVAAGAEYNEISTCEFIGIHASMLVSGAFSLSSPLFLVDDQGNRPAFEETKFTNFTECLMKAIDLSIEHDTFVVIVDDPITNKTLNTKR